MKRDRLVWIGDFFHTPRTVGATSSQIDLIEGTISQVFGTQLTSGRYTGYVSIDSQLGSRPEYKVAFTDQSCGGLNDFQDEFLRTVGDYYHLTGNTQFLSQYWNQ